MDPSDEDQRDRPRKRTGAGYRKPSLVRYGNLAALTAGGSLGTPENVLVVMDMGMGMVMVMCMTSMRMNRNINNPQC